ncbi:metal-dependent hydrolase [Shewanella marina]|uniref:metal-dependent hydrolase n=1 Tax=Shewanella marina TaxID=487319 RepID=UPI0004711420|nr:metal-dependent hydrolase [Shewanella marina]
MANFSTHFTVAAVTSGLAATALLSAHHILPITALWLTFIGTMGGLLPDIDSDHSTSMKTLFNVLAGFCCFVVVCHFYTKVTMVELICYLIATFSFVRLVVKSWFQVLTVHRGSCHSIAFVSLLGMITVCISHILGYQATTSWLTGGFVLLGGLVHLLLDEIYSVDLSNKKIKSSFGTALKPISLTYPVISFAQVVAIVALISFAPQIHSTVQLLSHWQQFQFKPHWLTLHNIERWSDNLIKSAATTLQGQPNHL